jgi:hypothetical protein
MMLLKRYVRNTPLFVDNKSGQTVKAKCDFVAYVDEPQVVPSQQHPFCAPAAANGPDSHEDIVRPAITHVMQLTGAVASAMARVLFDSGAEQHNYISAAFCERIGVTLRDSKSPLSVVGIAGAAADCATVHCYFAHARFGFTVELCCH